MSCEAKLYADADIDIPLSISAGSNFSWGDMQDLTITFTSALDSAVAKSYTLSSGKIAQDGAGVWHVEISKGDLIKKGKYRIDVRLDDHFGKVRKLTPCPEALFFY